ncbi:hypothetical protein ABVT39_007388 [Epinephelus coioides]
MGRWPRNTLPTARVLLAPTAYDPIKVKQLLDKTKDTQKFYHDRKRAGNHLVVLKPGDEVRMQPYPGSHKWSPGVVIKQHNVPRSYVVDCGNKEYRHNSQHLRKSTAAANHPRHWICQEPWTETSGLPEKEPRLPAPTELSLSPPKAPLSPT